MFGFQKIKKPATSSVAHRTNIIGSKAIIGVQIEPV